MIVHRQYPLPCHECGELLSKGEEYVVEDSRGDLIFCIPCADRFIKADEVQNLSARSES